MRSLLLFTLILLTSSFCLGQDQDTTTRTALPLRIQEEALDTTLAIWVAEPTPINLSEITKEIGKPPEKARSGTVVFRVLIDSTGAYARHQVLKTPDSLLTKHYEPYLPRIRFSPAILQGRPIPVWINIPFRFKVLH